MFFYLGEFVNRRVIARLDIKGPNLVKGIHLEGLRVLGSPEDFAKFYYDQGADELLYQDVVASLYERNSLREMIISTASQVFIPLTVGGGIRSIEDIRNVLRSGADKVSINTAAIKNPDLIKQASKEFGSSTIVIAIEAIRHNDGKYYAYVDNGREETGEEVLGWAKKVQELGAGEILLTSVDRDGTGEGFDEDLIEMVSSAVSIPVIAHGGPGRLEDIPLALNKGADAITVASVIHYDAINKIDYNTSSSEKEGNKEFLKKGNVSRKIKPCNISNIKNELTKNNIPCRV